MRHGPFIFWIALATSAASGQTSPGHDEVKQALQEALTLQAPAPATPPHLPESPMEPARAAAPEKKPTQAPASRLSSEVLERAGRMAAQTPASSVHAEPTHMGAATAHAAAASQSAAGQAQSEQVRQQHPPRPGTPGGRTAPPVVSPVSPHSTPPSSGVPGPNRH